MKKISVISVLLVCLLPSIHGMILKKFLIKKTLKNSTDLNQKKCSLSPEELVAKYFNEDFSNSKEIILIERSLIPLGEKENTNRCEITKGITHIHQIKNDKFANLESPIFGISNKINYHGWGLYAISDLQSNLPYYLNLFKSIKDVSVLAIILDSSLWGQRCETCKKKYMIEVKSTDIINEFEDGCSPKNKNQSYVIDKKNNRNSKKFFNFDDIMKEIKVEEKKNQCAFKKFIKKLESKFKKENINIPVLSFSSCYSTETIEKFVDAFDCLKN